MASEPSLLHKTIPDVARDAAEQWPDGVALRYHGESITFAQQYQRACALAKGLSNLGIGPGDHVATLIGGRPEWFYLSYAISLLGAVIVPINVTFRRQELEHVLRCADVKALVTMDEFRDVDYLALFSELLPERVGAAPGFLHSQRFPHLKTVVTLSPAGSTHDGCFDFNDVMHSGAHVRPSEVEAWFARLSPSAPSYILFTSGSTAFPKPALRSHGSNVAIAGHLYQSTFRMKPGDRQLGMSPFYHVGGCIYTTLGNALFGATTVLMDYFEAGHALKLIREEGITCMGGFDTHYRAMSAHPDFADTDVSGVDRIMLACGPEWYDKVRELGFGHTSVTHHYGFTEGTSVAVPPEENDEVVRKNSNGRPFPGCEVKIVNPETGRECAADEPGEICVRGWSLFLGYYKMPKQTAESMDDEGFFHTGDYGWKDAGGNVYYRGRFKQMVKTGGENVSQREVEMFLEQHPHIATVQVVGVPDDRWGEAVTAVVETHPGKDLELDTLKAFCKERIAGFKIPKHLVAVTREEWPITLTGKFDKPALRTLAMDKLGLNTGAAS